MKFVLLLGCYLFRRRWKVKTLLAGPSPTSPMRRRLPTPLFPTIWNINGLDRSRSWRIQRFMAQPFSIEQFEDSGCGVSWGWSCWLCLQSSNQSQSVRFKDGKLNLTHICSTTITNTSFSSNFTILIFILPHLEDWLKERITTASWWSVVPMALSLTSKWTENIHLSAMAG